TRMLARAAAEQVVLDAPKSRLAERCSTPSARCDRNRSARFNDPPPCHPFEDSGRATWAAAHRVTKNAQGGHRSGNRVGEAAAESMFTRGLNRTGTFRAPPTPLRRNSRPGDPSW